MIVLQQIRVGLSGSIAAETSAAFTASELWPSTSRSTSQPYDSKRFAVSSVNQPCTSPSMEIPLSSYNTTSLPSLSVPANEQTSCEMPSIRQPSPTNT